MATIWDNERFVQARQDREMAQIVAAEYLQITPEYLSMLENGRKQPSQSLILKMVKLYSKPITFFLQTEKGKLSA